MNDCEWRVVPGGSGGGLLARTGHRYGVEHLGFLGLRWRAEDVGVGILRTLGRGLSSQCSDLVDDVLHLVREPWRGCEDRVGGVDTLEVPLELVYGSEGVYVTPSAGVLAPDQTKGSLTSTPLLVVDDRGLV